MGIKELIGMESYRKIRYAIVGLGDIAQEDMMPALIIRVTRKSPHLSLRTR